jgi:hypothetical protein
MWASRVAERSGLAGAWRLAGAWLLLLWQTLDPRAIPEAPSEDSAASRVTALPEFWTLVAEHSELVGAWRLTGVCVASRVGAKAWLRTLRRLVVSGGYSSAGYKSAVWRLDLATLRWEPMPALVTARCQHACCAVRGNVVVLAGQSSEGVDLATVEVLKAGDHTFASLPPLSCGARNYSTALPIDESESAEGQVLLLGGRGEDGELLDEASRVLTVDLATGACTPHPPLFYVERLGFAAARLPDGRVVCAGGHRTAGITAEVLEPPDQGSPDGFWRWRELPHMSVPRLGAAGCLLSDGRFAVFGGWSGGEPTASCEALTLDGDEWWDPLPPMREARLRSTCAAVGGCAIVAGGNDSTVVEVYEDALGRWRRLPCSLPHGGPMTWAGSALT